MSFSGAKQAAQKAVKWLNLKFYSSQLMISVIYQEIKDISPARNEAEVPRTAEQVLWQGESLAALTKNGDTNLSSDIIQAI